MLKLRQRPFAAFWTGQSLALLGGNVAGFALPTVAIALLGASPAQIAALTTLQALAFPLLGMVIAALVERHRKRIAMAYSDIARFAVVSALPVLYFLHHLTIGIVVTVATVTAILGVVRDVAAQAYVPSVLPPEQIGKGNARLEMSNTAAQSLGPAIGGILMHLIAAPFALFVDAFSYLGSAVTLLFVEAEEPKGVPAEKTSVRGDIWEGLQFVFSTGNLGRIALCSATLNLAGSIAQVTSLIFFYRTLHLTPIVLGLLFAFSNVGFLGVLFASRIERKLGFVGALSTSIGLMAAARVLMPLAAFGFPLITAAASLILSSAAQPLYNIVQLTYRQCVTPLDMQARMNATMRTLNSITMPVGAALGGVLAARYGVMPALVLAAALTMCASFWIIAVQFDGVRETSLAAA
jgi:MFS family permease